MAPRVSLPPSHSGRRHPSASTIARTAELAATALANAESINLTLMEAMADGERQRVARPAPPGRGGVPARDHRETSQLGLGLAGSG
jgi:hypothetical protein